VFFFFFSNETTGTFSCPVANGDYCAGDSLSTNIIIRCINGTGFPGNCDDNLDGEFPQGDSFSPCWAKSPSSGIAACSKNCVVYGGSGDLDTFTLPNCVPSVTATTITATATGTATASGSTIWNSSNGTSVTTTTLVASSGTGLPPTYASTGVVPFPTNGTSIVYSSGSGASTSAGGGSSLATSTLATATPKSPTSSTSAVPTFTGAASSVKAGSAMAAVGFFAAFFL